MRARSDPLPGCGASMSGVARAYPGEMATASRCTPSTAARTVQGGLGVEARRGRTDRARRVRPGRQNACDGARISPRTLTRQRSVRAIVEKLRREPVEDFRIDFEDGYGNRPDAEEDGHAASAAREVAAGLKAGTLPPFIGIRIKPLSKELHRRSLRTLDIFVTTLVGATRGKLPPNFVVTIPKLMSPGARHRRGIRLRGRSSGD